MDDISTQETATELLQQLGLKEYEARCFVALSRLGTGTAKDISEISDVPRTRVYDAVRVLETKGLVEIQHTNPQQFRAVSVDEAARTLRSEYESRTEELRSTLTDLAPASQSTESEVAHEVWSLSGANALSARTDELVDAATDEVILVVGAEQVFTDSIVAQLETAQREEVSVIVGTVREQISGQVQNRLPDAEVFVSGLEWLEGVPGDPSNGTKIGRLLLVDREALLVSTVHTDDGEERGVFGRGLQNGFVTVVRRLLATGLLPKVDPASDGADSV
jgi:sugar-specific transcriptional regulator TrmB